jgi:hypothetical protein
VSQAFEIAVTQIVALLSGRGAAARGVPFECTSHLPGVPRQ